MHKFFHLLVILFPNLWLKVYQNGILPPTREANPIPVIKENGNAGGIYKEWSFTNPHGYSGGHLAYALNPHSTGKKVRTCASCHISNRVLGLGEGDINIGLNTSGKDDEFLPLISKDKALSSGLPLSIYNF